jgi:murein DD-endopeptidase MepM/ murein hydrolase activator NlpD
LGDVKALLAAPVALLVGVALLPVVLAGGDPPPPAVCGQQSGPIEVVLATIREIESGGDYRAQSAGSTASGAYQFLDSTWAGYGGYTRAKDAPPAVQDAKAADYAQAILDRHGGDVSAVPVSWYIGHVPEAGSPEWNTIPAAGAGNRLTPRQYQAKWMATYQRLLDQVARASTATTSATDHTTASAGSCIGGAVAAIADGWSLPGPRALIDADPGALDNPHAGYPAWDWLIPEGTPIYAVRGGSVAVIRTWPYNWWTYGCGSGGRTGCDTCGIGVTIINGQGVHWTYCHASNLTTSLGATVAAGQQIMWSGNTGRSGAPHLHLEIRVDGEPRCPQPLIESLYQHTAPIEPGTLPLAGCTF